MAFIEKLLNNLKSNVFFLSNTGNFNSLINIDPDFEFSFNFNLVNPLELLTINEKQTYTYKVHVKKEEYLLLLTISEKITFYINSKKVTLIVKCKNPTTGYEPKTANNNIECILEFSSETDLNLKINQQYQLVIKFNPENLSEILTIFISNLNDMYLFDTEQKRNSLYNDILKKLLQKVTIKKEFKCTNISQLICKPSNFNDEQFNTIMATLERLKIQLPNTAHPAVPKVTPKAAATQNKRPTYKNYLVITFGGLGDNDNNNFNYTIGMQLSEIYNIDPKNVLVINHKYKKIFVSIYKLWRCSTSNMEKINRFITKLKGSAFLTDIIAACNAAAAGQVGGDVVSVNNFDKIIIYGHSFGGLMATLLYECLLDTHSNIYEKLELLTFGSIYISTYHFINGNIENSLTNPVLLKKVLNNEVNDSYKPKNYYYNDDIAYLHLVIPLWKKIISNNNDRSQNVINLILQYCKIYSLDDKDKDTLTITSVHTHSAVLPSNWESHREYRAKDIFYIYLNVDSLVMEQFSDNKFFCQHLIFQFTRLLFLDLITKGQIGGYKFTKKVKRIIKKKKKQSKRIKKKKKQSKRIKKKKKTRKFVKRKHFLSKKRFKLFKGGSENDLNSETKLYKFEVDKEQKIEFDKLSKNLSISYPHLPKEVYNKLDEIILNNEEDKTELLLTDFFKNYVSSQTYTVQTVESYWDKIINPTVGGKPGMSSKPRTRKLFNFGKQ